MEYGGREREAEKERQRDEGRDGEIKGKAERWRERESGAQPNFVKRLGTYNFSSHAPLSKHFDV